MATSQPSSGSSGSGGSGFDISSSATDNSKTSFGAVQYGGNITVTSGPLSNNDLAYLGVQTPTQATGPGILSRFPIWALVAIPLTLLFVLALIFRRD